MIKELVEDYPFEERKALYSALSYLSESGLLATYIEAHERNLVHLLRSLDPDELMSIRIQAAKVDGIRELLGEIQQIANQ